MKLILCIESTADFCSVCLFKGDEILSYTSSDEKYAHSRYLAVLIDSCFKDKDLTPQNLDAIAISSGPGSYTGLRVGAAIAKGMSYALQVPLIAIDSLYILASPYFKQDSADSIIIPTIDARRDEAYISHFNTKGEQLIASTPHIFTNQSFYEYHEDKPIVVCGNAALKASQIIDNRKNLVFHQTLPTAKSMGYFAFKQFREQNFADTAYFEPNYIKSPNITTPKKPLIS